MTHRLSPLAATSLVIIFVLLAFAAAAEARPGKRDRRDWHVAVEGVTDFPLDAGGRLALELPLRLRFATTFGVVPDAYVEAVNAIILASGGYSEETGEIVSAALDSSFLWRVAAGWRPFADHGFYFELGYALATLDASLDGQTLYDAAVTIEIPGAADVDNPYLRRRYQLDSMLHMLTAEVGWEWVFDETWLIRVAAGMAATIAARSDLGYRSQRSGPLQHDELSTAYAAWLDDVYTSVLFTPVVAVAVGLRLY